MQTIGGWLADTATAVVLAGSETCAAATVDIVDNKLLIMMIECDGRRFCACRGGALVRGLGLLADGSVGRSVVGFAFGRHCGGVGG